MKDFTALIWVHGSQNGNKMADGENAEPYSLLYVRPGFHVVNSIFHDIAEQFTDLLIHEHGEEGSKWNVPVEHWLHVDGAVEWDDGQACIEFLSWRLDPEYTEGE